MDTSEPLNAQASLNSIKRAAIICPDGISVLLFCKGLIRALQQVPELDEIIVLSDDGPYKSEIQSLGVRSIYLPVERYLSPMTDLKYLLMLYRVLRRESCEVVINISTKPNIYGTFAARMTRTRIIIMHVLGLGGAFLESQDLRSRLIKAGVLSLYRLAFHLSNRVWFTNRHDAAFFLGRRAIKQERILLTNNYLDPSFYAANAVSVSDLTNLRNELGLSESDRIVLMVARMIWPKGVREFVEAAALLLEKRPDTKWLLVGPLEPGNPHAVQEEYLRDAERPGNFRWLGLRHDVRTLYALADVAALPTYYKEGGFPRGLLEPMAMGKPVVASDSDDCTGTVEEGKNGFLIPPRHPLALADAVDKLLASECLRTKFGMYAREKVLRDFDERQIISGAFKNLGIGKGKTGTIPMETSPNH